MNRLIIANELLKAAEALRLVAASKVRSENWDKIVMYLNNNTNCSAAAKATTNKAKATEKAIAQHSFEKKLKEILSNDAKIKEYVKEILSEVKDVTDEEREAAEKEFEKRLKEVNLNEVKLRFTDLTFDQNALNLGATEEEINEYVEPPKEYILKMLMYLGGKKVEFKVRRKGEGSGSSFDKGKKAEEHSAFQTFKKKFLEVLDAAGMRYSIRFGKPEEGRIITDTVKISLPDFGVTATFELYTNTKEGGEDKFAIAAWNGPKLESGVKTFASFPMEKLDDLAVDFAEAKFEGQKFTKVVQKNEKGKDVEVQGKSLMLLTPAEFEEYIDKNDMPIEELADVLMERKNKGKKDQVVATEALELMIESGNAKAKEFAITMKNIVNWKYLCKILSEIPEEIMEALPDKMEWNRVSAKGNLSEKFIKKFKDKLDLDILMENQKLTKRLKNELGISEK